MTPIIIILHAILIGCTYHELCKPNELLMPWARYWNLESSAPKLLRKLIVCPYCIAGQIALWASLFLCPEWVVVNVCSSILVTIFYYKQNK